MALSQYRLGKNGAKPDFFLATTCNTGRPCANYVMSLVDSTAFLAAEGMTFDYWIHNEDCHVDDARNFLVQEFLATEAPFMVFIDDDVGWDTENLVRLILHKNADIVGGSYPLKQDHVDWPVRIRSDVPTQQARPDGLLEVEGVPTGFMRIERRVLEAMSKKRKHMYYKPVGAHDDDKRCQVIFERMMIDGKRWSGDLNFCREARSLGFHVFVDPEMNFSHQGNKRWEGHMGNWLRETQGILDPRLDQAVERLLTGDASPEVFGDIVKYRNNPFAAGPHMLKSIYENALEAKGPILEVGTGMSTVVAGIACLRTGQTVHALEHDLEWFRVMRNYLQLWKLKPVNLYYAPLQEYPEHKQANGQPLMWHEIDEKLPKLFGLAIIDGPPRRYGREGVYKLMLDRIKWCPWIVDDTDEKTQWDLVSKYAAELGKIPEDRGLKVKGMRRYAFVP